ncbi:MAG: LysR family transcriptional regulator [Symbiopectobacterium sp.]
MEKRLGMPLFERSARGMVLNDAGQILPNHIRRSMADMKLAIVELEGLKSRQKTPIRVVCIDGLALNLVPLLLARFHQLHPEVNSHLIVGAASRCRSGCGTVKGMWRLNLAWRRILEIDVIASFPAPVTAFMHREHPLATRDFALSDLNAYPLVLPDQTATIRQLFDLCCRMNSMFIEPMFTSNQFSALLLGYVRNDSDAIGICSHFSVMGHMLNDELQLRCVNVEPLGQRMLQIQTELGRPRTALLARFFSFLSKR